MSYAESTGPMMPDQFHALDQKAARPTIAERMQVLENRIQESDKHISMVAGRLDAVEIALQQLQRETGLTT